MVGCIYNSKNVFNQSTLWPKFRNFWLGYIRRRWEKRARSNIRRISFDLTNGSMCTEFVRSYDLKIGGYLKKKLFCNIRKINRFDGLCKILGFFLSDNWNQDVFFQQNSTFSKNFEQCAKIHACSAGHVTTWSVRSRVDTISKKKDSL